MSAMSRKRIERTKRSTMPTAEMQRRARKIATQASNLADRAGPMTRSAASTARQRAGIAIGWAQPRVDQARGWMAVRADRGSVSIREVVGPRVADMLAVAARKLKPPKRGSRKLPTMMAGMAVLAAAAAAVTAVSLRNRNAMRSVSASRASGAVEQPTAPSPEAEQAKSEAEVGGLSRTS